MREIRTGEVSEGSGRSVVRSVGRLARTVFDTTRHWRATPENGSDNIGCSVHFFEFRNLNSGVGHADWPRRRARTDTRPAIGAQPVTDGVVRALPTGRRQRHGPSVLIDFPLGPRMPVLSLTSRDLAHTSYDHLLLAVGAYLQLSYCHGTDHIAFLPVLSSPYRPSTMSTSDLRAQLTAPENTGLALRDVGFSATASTFPPRARAPPKRVIDGVSCLAPAGEVVFIIGASGSGKTSVLDAIADRVASSVDGVVSLNGQVATARELKRHVKYVPQTPYLYETLTVDETLNYAASFYCPQRAVRAHRVENALVALGLASARNVKCGGVFYRGLSGGQRRRVAIAIELVARPTVLLLDEPTTGLDSTGAHAVMSHLRELATRERLAIICTIHQPPRRMLDLCDRLLLLADGRVAFSGRMTDVIPHFHSLGRELPPRTNVAEWLLNETSSDFQDDPERVAQLLDAWPKSECCSKLEQELADAIQPKPDSANEGNGTPNGRSTDDDKPESAEDNAVYKRSIAVQTALLAKRNVVEAFRNPAVVCFHPSTLSCHCHVVSYCFRLRMCP